MALSPSKQCIVTLAEGSRDNGAGEGRDPLAGNNFSTGLGRQH